jgi:hypothetical protein
VDGEPYSARAGAMDPDHRGRPLRAPLPQGRHHHEAHRQSKRQRADRSRGVSSRV